MVGTTPHDRPYTNLQPPRITLEGIFYLLQNAGLNSNPRKDSIYEKREDTLKFSADLTSWHIATHLTLKASRCISHW